MTKDEIIKQLLDMAKYPTVTLPRDCEALKAAAKLLAQPEPELTAKLQRLLREDGYLTNGQAWDLAEKIAPFCAHPKEWQDLTDEEMRECLGNHLTEESRARAIVRRLKEKNT